MDKYVGGRGTLYRVGANGELHKVADVSDVEITAAERRGVDRREATNSDGFAGAERRMTYRERRASRPFVGLG